MKTIEYFKLQAKNLHKDFKTQKPHFDPSLGRNLYEYAPKFFDVDALITDFGIDEDNFTLMNAQHIIAKLAGFKKWTEMVNASPSALEVSKRLFDNIHKIRIKKTAMQISALPLAGAERMEFIRMANSVFENVLHRIEPGHPELVRKSWNPEQYIDEILLTPDMLPIDRNYALSLIDAFLVHHVIGLAVEADD